MKYEIISVTILTVCFSTIFASAQDKVVVVPLGKSSVKAINDSSPCDTAKAGTIRWTGINLEVCDGKDWVAIFTESVKTVTSTTGQVWMDRNLGASRVATSSTDSAAYGDLYQWGRLSDGHEQINSPRILSALSVTDVPGHGSFITMTDPPNDWRSSQNDSLWQGISGTNNPCPSGFRLPTESEWEAERVSWNSNDAAGAFASPLKLVLAGGRYHSTGELESTGSNGTYWSSTVDGIYSRYLRFFSGSADMLSNWRARGFSVRCIKD